MAQQTALSVTALPGPVHSFVAKSRLVTIAGLEFTMPVNRMHFVIPKTRFDFTMPVNRMHFVMRRED